MGKAHRVIGGQEKMSHDSAGAEKKIGKSNQKFPF